MRFLAEAAQDLNSSLELKDVFQKIAQRVRNVVDSHLFCVMLWDDERELLHHSYSLKLGQHIEQDGTFPLNYGISGTCAALRRPIRVADVSRDSRYVRFRHAEVDIRSELCVPLLLKGRLVGVLDLESLEPDAFTAEHEAALVALASHVATALENARLYERVRAHEQRMHRDLTTARRIQAGLLPREVPQPDGFELGKGFAPARELAGDFYDFLPYRDGRLALAVGDVAGKATPAALYGSLAVGIIRGHVVQHHSEPAEMLAHLNDHLGVLHIEERFLAMVYGVLDLERRRFTFANAAFPWPRLLREGRVSRFTTSGFPLGPLPTSRYDEITLELRPKDVLVICSDGLEDGLDGGLEPSGGDRLDAWLQRLADCDAQTIAEELVQASEPTLGGKPPAADDRTVVVLRAR